ncbi:PTS sugar transporter subunit IIA [Trichloromonas sp.]|uniref:PTS sugar transporter subunit IIA n=1 Tax=Trichloromonas sp. TaxID=3069249 RepID=UPI003D815B63
MTGLVIATHARLGEELLNAAEMIIGPTASARAVSICMGDSVESIRERIETAISEVGGDGEGVVIMTDMFGGTPSNISLSFLETERIEVITGVNLPMVLKFFNSQEDLSLGDLSGMIKAYGEQSISLPSEFLKK